MKRGFLHVIEIVIITLVMFVVILQFTYIPGIPMNYDKTKLIIRGKDILFSLDEKGVNWLNKSSVQEEIDSLLKDTNIIYGLEIRNAIKTPIQVGCLCDGEELAFIETLLKPFTLNRGNISFYVHKIDPPVPGISPAFSQEDATLPLFYDVIVAFDYGLAEDGEFDYTNELRNYLSAGKGLVQVRDLDEEKLTDNSDQLKIYNYFFGL